MSDKTNIKNISLSFNDLQNLLSHIVKSIPLYLFVKDSGADLKYIYSSSKIDELYSKKVSNPIGLTDQELFDDKEMAARFREMDKNIIETGEKQQFFEKIKDGEGNLHTDLTVKVPIHRENGAPLLLGMSVDMTELLEKEESLRMDNLSITMACQVGNIIPWQYNFKTGMTIFKHMHQEHSSTMELNRDELSKLIHPDDFSLLESRAEAMRGGQIASCDFEIRSIYHSHHYHWFSVYGRNCKWDEAGHPLVATGILRDISEEKRRAADLNARRQAEESNRLKDAFIANMSHEIRTPLNAIVGFSQLMTVTTDESDRKEYTQIIEKNTTLMLQLIDDILDLSQLDSGVMEFHEGPFSLNEALRQLRATYAFRLNPGVKLNLVMPDHPYMFISNKRRVEQVLSNLLANATKFTERGSITYGFEARENGVYIYVTDTGRGMDAASVSSIFERFVKIDSFKQGIGLGLCISKMIVDRLKGEIGVLSTIGKGSTFWFEIPGKIWIEDPLA